MVVPVAVALTVIVTVAVVHRRRVRGGPPSGDRCRYAAAADAQRLAGGARLGAAVARGRRSLRVALRVLARAKLAPRLGQRLQLWHLDGRLEAAVGQLLAEPLLEVEDGRRVVDVDLDSDRLVGAARDSHRLDSRRRDGVDVDLARVDRLARAAL